MSTIVIEDAFRPEIYARSIVEPMFTSKPVEKTGLPTWTKVVIAIIGLGILAVAVYPRVEQWLERKFPTKPKDELEEN